MFTLSFLRMHQTLGSVRCMCVTSILNTSAPYDIGKPINQTCRLIRFLFARFCSVHTSLLSCLHSVVHTCTFQPQDTMHVWCCHLITCPKIFTRKKQGRRNVDKLVQFNYTYLNNIHFSVYFIFITFF